MKSYWPEILAVTLVSFFLCLSPWTGTLSFEFSFFLSILIFPIVFFSSMKRTKRAAFELKQKVQWVGYYLLLLIIPLTMVSLYSAKYGTCRIGVGLLWFLLLPVVTVVFTVSSAFFARSYKNLHWMRYFIGLFPFFAFSILTVRDMYVDPSLSFYHPVLGYFPGPLYDEWIPRFSALYTYRFWILLFSGWLLLRGNIPEGKWRLCALIIAPFFLRNELGWHHSHKWIQKHLTGKVQSRYTEIYYAGQNSVDMRQLGKSLDFYVDLISEKLELKPEEKIRVYIYENAYQKKRWTGTGNTFIGNPIQRTLQILPTDASDPILVHELSHVVAAPIGISMLHISPRIGLLEGLATSFQTAQMGLSVHEWAKAMVDLNKLPDLTQSLDALSFWKENPTRVYLASGSFVQWIMDTYGVDKFKKVYHGDSFDSIYQMPLEILLEEWKKSLTKIEISESSMDLANYFLSQKPFFQKRCVHEVAELEVKFSNCKDNCVRYLDLACDLDPSNPDLRLRRARHVFKSDISSALDTTMIPLPAATNTRTQNNMIQLLKDDIHHAQDPTFRYRIDSYEYPSFDLLNTIMTRMYLSKNAPNVLEGILLGTYVPDPNLEWPKEAYYNQAMLYFARSATKAEHFEKSLHFLSMIDIKKEDKEFELAYWELSADAFESLGRYDDATKAYKKMSRLTKMKGKKDFANLQIRRLDYLSQN